MATETVRETLTPEDVENKTFTPVRLREGYDMAEVDHFLDEVVATLRKIDADTEGLRRDAARNSPGLGGGASTNGSHGSGGAATVLAEPVPAAESVASEESVASANGGTGPANRMTATEATSAAVRVLQMAQDEADRIRAEAAGASDNALSEARGRAAELEEKARAQAARVTAESQQRAGDLDEQTRSRRVEMFGALEAERARLATDVDGLRAFEREYRIRLRTYFKDQISRLDAERSPGAGLSTDGGSGPEEHRTI